MSTTGPKTIARQVYDALVEAGFTPSERWEHESYSRRWTKYVGGNFVVTRTEDGSAIVRRFTTSGNQMDAAKYLPILIGAGFAATEVGLPGSKTYIVVDEVAR